MTTQRLHSALAPIDVLTRDEMEQVLQREVDSYIRELTRGLEIQRIPYVPITALAATTQLFTANDATPWGPEQGDLWMLRRVIVKSNVLTDAAKYTIFRGSTPSDIANSYSTRFLLENQSPGTPAINQPVPPAIVVGASPFTFVNTQPYGVNVSVTGGTVTTIAINGQTLSGVTGGTFFLNPDASITVTYTVAPAMTEANATANVAAVPPGISVNAGFYFSTKAVFLQPGEQVYAQINGATVGNQYYLEGEAIRVPAEMKGKVL